MDFSMGLFLVLVVTGIVLLWDRFFGAPGRARKRAAGKKSVNNSVNSDQPPLLVEYTRALFPVIAIVFVLRSFIIEPFRIPSGSMIPTLHIGDFILVSKFKYGLRLPVIHKKIVPLGEPQAGDVMVFRYPCDGDRANDRPCIQKQNFIKRVIGTPGDSIVYENKKLFINGQELSYQPASDYALEGYGQSVSMLKRWVETIGENEHEIIVDGQYNTNGRLERTVPDNAYFVMGDNRDGSSDSRSWGFVPEEYVVGKAFLIWFSWKKDWVDFSRIGNRIR